MVTDTTNLPGKKQILRDPVAALAQLTDCSPEATQKIITLWQQLQPLRQQIKQQQLDSKKLSRQIGEAKKNSGSNSAAAEQRLKRMRTASTILKQLQKEQADFEQKILTLFKVTSTTADRKTNNKTPRQRPYPQAATRIAEISITELSDREFNDLDSTWNDYVRKHPAGCIHHRSEWRQIFQQTYNHNCLYLLARDNAGTVCGILPLVQLQSRLFGNILVSMPWFQRAGAIADHPAIEEKLMAAATLHARQQGCKHIEFRDDIKRDALPAQEHKVNMLLELPPDPAQLWQQFKPKLRAQIKRPQREKPQTHFGREELLADFYAVYSRNMRDLGSPVHSRQLIRNTLRAFPDNSWLVVVYLKQKPVSAGFLIADRQTMEIPLASTVRTVNHLSMNMLLYWEILQFAIRQGYLFFDFGRSSRGAGTYNFKKQWGAQPKPLYWHYWLPEETEMPGLNPDNPKFKLLIALWKQLPLKLSQLLGPAIVKNIP